MYTNLKNVKYPFSRLLNNEIILKSLGLKFKYLWVRSKKYIIFVIGIYNNLYNSHKCLSLFDIIIIISIMYLT